MSIRIGIVGYGNLGRGVELALRMNPDMELAAFFTRRAPETLKTLQGWMDQANIKPEMIQTLVAQKGHFPADKPIDQYPEKFVRGWLMHNWSQVVTTIQSNPEYTPF